MIIERLSDETRFTATEKKVIEFIQEHPRVVTNLSLDDLAAACFTSQASIIRLCKKLGTKGFAEFKVQLASELSLFAQDNREISVDIPIEPDSNSQEIAKTFYNLSRRAIESTRNSLDHIALQKAARLLAYSDLIHVYGRGESLIIAEDFHYKLIRIGMNSVLESALVVSQYCNSPQVHYIIDELMSANIPFVLVTAAEKAWPYDKFAQVTLRISCTESRYKMGSFASRNAFLYLLDCLYGTMFSLNYEQNKQNLSAFSQRKVERSYYYTYLPDTETNY